MRTPCLLFYEDTMLTFLFNTLFQTKNLNLRVKNEPVTVGADTTVHVWFLAQICKHKPVILVHQCSRSLKFDKKSVNSYVHIDIWLIANYYTEHIKMI